MSVMVSQAERWVAEGIRLGREFDASKMSELGEQVLVQMEGSRGAGG